MAVSHLVLREGIQAKEPHVDGDKESGPTAHFDLNALLRAHINPAVKKSAAAAIDLYGTMIILVSYEQPLRPPPQLLRSFS